MFNTILHTYMALAPTINRIKNFKYIKHICGLFIGVLLGYIFECMGIPEDVVNAIMLILLFGAIVHRMWVKSKPKHDVSTYPRIIAFSGCMRTGKDTSGSYCVEQYGYNHIYFSLPLKNICKQLGLNDDQLYGDLKAVVDPFFDKTPRSIMQFVGTELFRDRWAEFCPQIGNNLWVELVRKQIIDNPDKRFVITDCRYKNEADMVQKLGGIVIKLQRDTGSKDTHVSETSIDSIIADYDCDNNGSIDDLYRHIDKIIQKKND